MQRARQRPGGRVNLLLVRKLRILPDYGIISLIACFIAGFLLFLRNIYRSILIEQIFKLLNNLNSIIYVGRKVVMSVTGIALVLFLTFHMAMNLVALVSANGYNMVCEFLGANWYALVATVGLAALFIIHIIYAFWLTMQNRKARGSERYAVTEKPKTVEWASQNMLVLGIIVIVGLGLHLVNFWAKMQLPELMHNMGMHADTLTLAYAANGVYHIQNTFSNPVFVVLYLVWLGALWFHLTHGFWSSMQSLGWNNKVWINRWKCISNIYSTIVVLCFALVVVVFFAKSLCGAC